MTHFHAWLMVLAGGYFLAAIGFLMMFLERRRARKNQSKPA